MVGVPSAVWLARRLLERPIYDMRLVQEKVSRIAYVAEIRLAVFAPADTPPAAMDERLDRLAAAYRQFNLAAGNGLEPRRLRQGRSRPAPAASAGPGEVDGRS